MASKQVRDELKVGNSMVAAGEQWSAEIAQRRCANLARFGLCDGADEAQMRDGIRLDLRVVSRCGKVLLDADTDLDALEAVEPGTLAQRDQHLAGCLAGLVGLREVIAAVCGETAVRALGFDGATPRDAVSVEQLAERVLDRLLTSPPTPAMRGVTLDLGAMTAELRADHRSLVQSNAAVLHSRRGLQLARARRDEAWTIYSAEKTCAAQRLDALLRTVGLGDVADGLLPARSKPSNDASADKKDTPEKKEVKAKEPEQPSAESKATKPAVAVVVAVAPAPAAPSSDAVASTQVTPTPPSADAPRSIPAVNTRPSMPAPPS